MQLIHEHVLRSGTTKILDERVVNLECSEYWVRVITLSSRGLFGERRLGAKWRQCELSLKIAVSSRNVQADRKQLRSIIRLQMQRPRGKEMQTNVDWFLARRVQIHKVQQAFAFAL